MPAELARSVKEAEMLTVRCSSPFAFLHSYRAKIQGVVGSRNDVEARIEC